MTYRTFITPRALQDLRDIRDYIARRNPDNAAIYLEKILDAFDVIEASPHAYGKAAEDRLVPYALHQFVLRPYRVLYRVEGNVVQILHVRHGARRRAKRDELP